MEDIHLSAGTRYKAAAPGRLERDSLHLQRLTQRLTPPQKTAVWRARAEVSYDYLQVTLEIILYFCDYDIMV